MNELQKYKLIADFINGTAERIAGKVAVMAFKSYDTNLNLIRCILEDMYRLIDELNVDKEEK